MGGVLSNEHGYECIVLPSHADVRIVLAEYSACCGVLKAPGENYDTNESCFLEFHYKTDSGYHHVLICFNKFERNFYIVQEKPSEKFSDVFELLKSIGRYPLIRNPKLADLIDGRRFCFPVQKEEWFRDMSREESTEYLKKIGNIGVGLFRSCRSSQKCAHCGRKTYLCMTYLGKKGFEHVLVCFEKGYYHFLSTKKSARKYSNLKELAESQGVQIVETVFPWEYKFKIEPKKSEKSEEPIEEEEHFVDLSEITEKNKPKDDISPEKAEEAKEKIREIVENFIGWLN